HHRHWRRANNVSAETDKLLLCKAERDFSHACKNVVGVGNADDDFLQTKESLGVELGLEVEVRELAPRLGVGGEGGEQLDEGEDCFILATEVDEEGDAAFGDWLKSWASLVYLLNV